MTREEITIMADPTVCESTISLEETRTGGLPVTDEKNQLISLAIYLDIVPRHPMAWPRNQRNIDDVSALQVGMRTGEGQ